MTTSDPDAVVPPPPEAPADERVLEVVEERLAVGKARVAGATVRVSTTTEVVEETVEVELDRYRVEITRVPIGKPSRRLRSPGSKATPRSYRCSRNVSSS